METTVNVTSKELRNLSLEFRTVAGRLIHTDFEESLKNTTRFLNFIEGNPIIWDFIKQHNQRQFNMREIVESKGWNERFDIPTDKSEEIAFTYQLLRYAVDSATPLHYLAQNYARSKKFQDMVLGFTKAVVVPLVMHINNYLNTLIDDLNHSPSGSITVNVTGPGQANVAISGSHITAQNTIHAYRPNITETIDYLVRLLPKEGISTETQTELMETLSAIKDEVNKQESCPVTIRVLVKYAKKVLSGVVLSVNALEAFEQLWSLLQRAGVL